MEMYGGAPSPSASADQETREEYEMRKAAKKKDKKGKKHAQAETIAEEKPRVIQTQLRVLDAEEDPFRSMATTSSSARDGPIKDHEVESDEDNERDAKNRSRGRVDSLTSDEASLNFSTRRQRVDSSSDEEGSRARQPNDIDLDSDGDIAVRRRRGNKRSDPKSESKQNSSKRNTMDIDSDGDVQISSTRRRRRPSTSSSSSSSSEEEFETNKIIGLKTREEFAEITASNDQSSKGEIDEYALGKGQSTVYRDKQTGEIKQPKPKSKEEISRQNELLNFELNMGAFDKLGLKGIAPGISPEDEILEEDPMARFLRKSNSEEELTLTGKPKYKGPSPHPNRFQIPPGYRWDGVDRSNGFELRLLKQRKLQPD
jgi:pre-mRNA-splicing factor CWC26